MSEILINGKLYSDKNLTLPGRLFREAWADPKSNVVLIDVAKAAVITHGIRRVWRDWKDTNNFPYDFGGGTVFFSKDMKSVARITGAVNMASILEALGQTFSSSWADVDGNDHAANRQWIEGLFLSMGAHTSSIHAENKLKWQAIEAADAEELGVLADEMLADMGGM